MDHSALDSIQLISTSINIRIVRKSLSSNCWQAFHNFFFFTVDALLAEGVDPTTGEYKIPPGLPEDKVNEQLKLMKAKKTVTKPPLKVQKVEETKEIRNFQIFSPPNKSTATSTISLSSQSDKNVENMVISPTSSKLSNKPGILAGISSLQKKQDEKDFFKERSKIFRAKNPEEMRSPSPPQPSTSASEKKFNPANEKQLEEAMKQFLPVILPRGQMADKLKKAAPYNIFLTTVTAAPETHTDPLSVTFQELLDSSLGELESSVQFNFMIDIGWLLAQYAFAKCSQQPLLILYGQDMPGLSDINKKRPNVNSIKVNIPTPIGCHHTKMMLLFYKDKSMRVVISTANLYEDDWDNRVQGMWISDKFPALDEGFSHTTHGESETKFREDLTRYLIFYNIPKLQPIIAKLREIDFSSVKVFFISSVPGSHRDSGNGIHYGHPRAATLLRDNSAPIDESCPIILQASSIGSLGSSAPAYLTGEIAASFKRDSAPVGLRRIPNVKLIYPSLSNVISSHDGMAGGGCLPYNGGTHDKQRWLNEHLYQWKAKSRNRNRAMPHIKSYCRYSDRGLYWFILTSANMSRSAWGTLSKVGSKNLNPTLRINSYEVGVAFFPRVILGKERFPMNEQQMKDDSPIFKLPFDIPPIPFGKDDVPYCAEYLKAYLTKYGAN